MGTTLCLYGWPTVGSYGSSCYGLLTKSLCVATQVKSKKLNPDLERWRWGEPEWYLSSAAVTDAEILNRIYFPNPWLGKTGGGPATTFEPVATFQDPERAPVAGMAQVAPVKDLGAIPAPAPPGAAAGSEGGLGGVRESGAGEGGSGGGEEERLSAAENPKYRRLCLEAARRVLSSGGAAVWSTEVGTTLKVETFFDAESGDLSTLLIDTSPSALAAGGAEFGGRVIGHVLAKDAGVSDAELSLAINKAFPSANPQAEVPPKKRSKIQQLARVIWPRAGGGAAGAEERGRRMAGVVSVVIDRERRGGLGTPMMRAAHEAFAAEGFEYVLLQQRDSGSGKLIAFYEALGYRDAKDFIDVGMLADISSKP
ncbi:hypothetical protein T484DRAFT_1932704 [Baffinella frigidus]|nr:hypothetical protein T484DRAFT_1932704 [Cryptophyta sp. CCMP2293]